MTSEEILQEARGQLDEDGFPTGRIPRERFTSPAILQDELDKLFTRTWLLACPLSDIANPGDAFPFTVGYEPIVVVRGNDDKVRAFFNVCQHRGRQIVTERRNVRSLFCRFHGLDWNLDGTICNIPDKSCFQGYTDETDLDLPEIRCEVWQGLVWINMDPDAEDLRTFLGEAGQQLEAYGLADYNVVAEVLVEWDCNWKIAADTFHEGYHGPTTHPQLQFLLEDDKDMPIDLMGLHSRGLYQMGAPCKRLPPHLREKAHPTLAKMAADVGIDADDYIGRLDEMRLAMQKARRQSLESRGFDVSALSDDQMTDDHHYFLFPNITLNMFAERFSVFRYMPHPSDPARCTFWVLQFARPEKPGTTAPRPEPEFGRGMEYKFENEVYNQDANNIPWVQKGVQSRAFKGMLFNRQERRLRHFYHSIDHYLASN